MRELLGDLDRWRQAGKRVAIARVVDTEGSGPREPGAAMAVTEDGEVAGSVSGGCVEGAVVTEALEILRTGDRRVVSFGYSDEDAFAVGLTCGGTVHLFIEQLLRSPATQAVPGRSSAGASSLASGEPSDVAWYDELATAVRTEEPVALATVIDGPGTGGKLLVRPDVPPLGTLGDPDLDRVVARDALGELASGLTGVRRYGPHGEAREDTVVVFVESFAPPRMFVFGAVDFTGALVRVAKVLGYRVTVCDAREVFATKRRFPLADDVVVDWPDRLLARVGASLTERDAICVLTHDAKFDVPALLGALETRAGYIGAMGSRRTHADRVARLQEAGVDEAGLARIRAPIGLDLGARTPEETAVAICAEIIADRTRRVGVHALRDTSGPIH
ncbi:MAG: XdhC family protein [Acidimicrobiales bacterium]